MSINKSKIADQAKKEVVEEYEAEAVDQLKVLYRRKEKAQLALKNIDREIDNYLSDIEENAVYKDAGLEVVDGE